MGNQYCYDQTNPLVPADRRRYPTRTGPTLIMTNPPMKSRFNIWLANDLPKRKPRQVIAYCFNIAEKPKSFCIELVGSRSYHSENEDWPCDESWTCRPNVFYLPRKDYTDWTSALAATKELISSFMATHNTLLNDAQAVAVGFVDGDLVTISTTSETPPSMGG